MMGDKGIQIIYGAILHDIGKLLMRAGVGVKNHSDLGAEYLQQNKNQVNLPVEVIECAKYHHHSKLRDARLRNDHIAYIVYEADNISSGAERRDGESDTIGFEKDLPLASVFNLIGKKTSNGYPLRSLNEKNKVNYPVDTKTVKADKFHYQGLYEDFDLNFKKIRYTPETINSLLELIESTMTYIPSSTKLDEVPDISLYDHLKLTAAISSCMLSYFEDNDINDFKEYCMASKKAEFRDENSYIMVSGDISGIQDFIYTIASKGALKSLRARSFYLEILLEHIVDEILSELSLSRANLIYTGGGHFYLLLPNTKKALKVIEEAKISTNKWFYEQYSIGLYLELGYVECSANDLMNPPNSDGIRENRTGLIFKRLSEKLSRNKMRRYGKDELAKILSTSKDVSENIRAGRECTVCGTSSKEIIDWEYANSRTSMGDICHSCEALFNIGKKLLEEECAIVITDQKPEGLFHPLPALKEDQARYFQIINLNQINKNQDNLIRIYSKNKLSVGESLSTNLWIGDYVFNKDGKKLTEFEHLAKLSEGIERIAVMRADIDDLGSVFTNGFIKNDEKNKFQYVTISRYTSLSRHLSLFFKRYIKNVCKGESQGEGNAEFDKFTISTQLTDESKKLIIVYSGGDDLFVVGAWNDVIDFAVDLRNSFDLYTSGKLTFSAGIGLFSSSYPISRMASISQKLENAAKNNLNKNSIALFGENLSIKDDEDNLNTKDKKSFNHIYSWDDFKHKVRGEKLKFFYDCFYFNHDEPILSKVYAGNSFLYKLFNVLEGETDKFQKQRNRVNLAHLAYLIARHQPSKKNIEALESYKNVRENLYKWAACENDRKELLTAINLLVYLNRKR
jgi:CRISPR-associated protein Csm1